ncbi:hypothetical protein ACFXJO_16365 [Streptomyces lavendulae]|uniref:hypothetical protein n=1 Tax=Streptomyces lavendulae TaxID=1914 RepID=UPI0036B88023
MPRKRTTLTKPRTAQKIELPVDYDRPAPPQDLTPEGPVPDASAQEAGQPRQQVTALRPPQQLSGAEIEATAIAAGMHGVHPVHKDDEIIGYTALGSDGLYSALTLAGRIVRLNHRGRPTAALWLQRNPDRTTAATKLNPPEPATPSQAPLVSGSLRFFHTKAERAAQIADLKAAVADKADHARYAHRLISHYKPGGTLADEPDHEDLMDVSLRIGAALSNDIQAIYRRTSHADPVDKHSAYRADYRRVRQEDLLKRKRRSAQARRTAVE